MAESDPGDEDSNSIAFSDLPDDVDSCDDEQPVVKRRRQQARALVTFGPWVIVLLVSAELGLWSAAGPLGVPLDEAAEHLPPDHVIGLGLARWHLLSPGQASDIPAPLLQLERNRCQANDRYGFVVYRWAAFARLSEPFRIAQFSAQQLMEQLKTQLAKTYFSDSRAWSNDAQTCQDIATGWQQSFGIRPPRMCQLKLGCNYVAYLSDSIS